MRVCEYFFTVVYFLHIRIRSNSRDAAAGKVGAFPANCMANAMKEPPDIQRHRP